MIFCEAKAGVPRADFSKCLSAEGLDFAEGYVRPLYLQPTYQQKCLFKHGYPFSAVENKETYQEYLLGTCPVAESLHFEKVMLSEHIRPPQDQTDLHDITNVLDKLALPSAS